MKCLSTRYKIQRSSSLKRGGTLLIKALVRETNVNSLQAFWPALYEGLSMCALPPDSFHLRGDADSSSCEKCRQSPNQPTPPEFHLAAVIAGVGVDCSARCKGWRLPGDCFNRLPFLWRWRAGQDELLFTSLQLINRQKWSSGEQTPVGAAQTRRPRAPSVAVSHFPPEVTAGVARQKSRTARLDVNDVIR